MPPLSRVALYRACAAVVPDSLDALRPVGAHDPPVALLCKMPGCEACAKFETEGGRAAFEATRLPPRTEVVEWNCGYRGQRDLALRYEVDDLPAYVVVPPAPAPIRVVRPSE